jgi:hypothetical protein
MIGLVFLVKPFLLLALIRLLEQTEQPFMCAGIYTFIRVLFGFLLGEPIGSILLVALVGGAMAALYFWVLDKLMGKGFIFWTVAIAGLVIGMV